MLKFAIFFVMLQCFLHPSAVGGVADRPDQDSHADGGAAAAAGQEAQGRGHDGRRQVYLSRKMQGDPFFLVKVDAAHWYNFQI